MSKTAGGRLVTIILTCSYCTCELHAGPVKCRALLLCMHTNANHLYRQSLTHCTMCHVATISMWQPVIPRERHKQGPHVTMVTGYIDLYPFSSPYFPHAQMIELGVPRAGQALPGNKTILQVRLACLMPSLV